MKKKPSNKIDTSGYVVGKEVFVLTPPNVPTFELPTTEEIEKLQVGHTVKLIFANKEGGCGERMWVEITHQLESSPIEWVGRLRNQPFGLPAEFDDVVRFAPKAIIDFWLKPLGEE